MAQYFANPDNWHHLEMAGWALLGFLGGTGFGIMLGHRLYRKEIWHDVVRSFNISHQMDKQSDELKAP
jgi:hypothetical protein